MARPDFRAFAVNRSEAKGRESNRISNRIESNRIVNRSEIRGRRFGRVPAGWIQTLFQFVFFPLERKGVGLMRTRAQRFISIRPRERVTVRVLMTRGERFRFTIFVFVSFRRSLKKRRAAQPVRRWRFVRSTFSSRPRARRVCFLATRRVSLSASPHPTRGPTGSKTTIRQYSRINSQFLAQRLPARRPPRLFI